MSTLADNLQSLASRHLPALLTHLWSSTIFLAVALIVIVLLRKRLTAGTRFTIALVGIAKFAIPGTVVMNALRSLGATLLPTKAPEQLEIPWRVLTGPFTLAGPEPRGGFGLLIALGASLLVTVVLVGRFTLMRQRLTALSVRTALPPEPREVEALARARRRVGVRRSIDLARSPIPETPAVLRAFRPVIVLPLAGCDDLSDAELESILCHECAHVARHDNLIARLEYLVCALFWFHPLIWIAKRIAATERERACDEVVSASAGERDTYLAALAKFCHAAIAPRLPGVSCMATSKLKERMDHVMGYPEFRTRAMSPRRVGIVAAASLVAFTVVSGLVGEGRAWAETSTAEKESPTANASAERLEVNVAPGSEAGTFACFVTLLQIPSHEKSFVEALGTRIGEKSEKVWGEQDSDGNGHEYRLSCSINESGTEAVVELRRTRVETGKATSTKILASKVSIARGGTSIQPAQGASTPDAVKAKQQFTGAPIDMSLKDADLRDVIKTFGQLTSLEMRVADGIEGKVSVQWDNVPWDQAFDQLMTEYGLNYRKEESVIHISTK